MKKLCSFVLMAAVLLQSSALLTTRTFAQTGQTKLTNGDVLQMAFSGLPAEIIVAKIKSSPNEFDTASAVLLSLKKSGVADAIILAMVQSSKQTVSNTPPALNSSMSGVTMALETEITIPDGTEVEIELKNTISGQELQPGDKIDFVVVRDVEINGKTVVERGASATGSITTAKKAGHWGKGGKLEWSMREVLTANGERIPMRFVKKVAGAGKSGSAIAGTVATALIFWPAAPLWAFRKGKKAVIPAGTKYSAYIDGDSKIKIKNDRTN